MTADTVDKVASAPDEIRVHTLKIFTFLWVSALLFHLTLPRIKDAIIGLDTSAIFLIPILIACIAAILKPSSIRRLALVAFLYSIYFFYSLPTYVNHAIMFFMVDFTIIMVFVWLWKGCRSLGGGTAVRFP